MLHEGHCDRGAERQLLDELCRSKPRELMKFVIADPWAQKLFVALLRQHGIEPVRVPRQRKSTVMAPVSAEFAKKILWPQYRVLYAALHADLEAATNRVISDGLRWHESLSGRT